MNSKKKINGVRARKDMADAIIGAAKATNRSLASIPCPFNISAGAVFQKIAEKKVKKIRREYIRDPENYDTPDFTEIDITDPEAEDATAYLRENCDPCPWCATKDGIYLDSEDDFVQCTSCEVAGPQSGVFLSDNGYKYMEHAMAAIAKWNARRYFPLR